MTRGNSMSEKETMARDSTAFGVHETGGGGMMSSTLSARELNATAITELQKKALVRIVDDDEGLRVSYRFLLEGEGWFVRCYESAEDFLENDCPFFPGCIILDVRMPGMSGLELQRFLEKQAMRPRIVFVSAHGSIPMAVKAVKDGAVDFLTKRLSQARSWIGCRTGYACEPTRNCLLRGGLQRTISKRTSNRLSAN